MQVELSTDAAVGAPSAEPFGERDWAALLERLRRDRSDLWQPWFGQLRPLGLAGGLLTVAGPDGPRTDWLNRTAILGFTEAAQAVTGHLVGVRFAVAGSATVSAADAATVPTSVAGVAPVPPPSSGPSSSESWTGSTHFDSRWDRYLARPGTLFAEYTFDNFVVGPSNRFAHAACVAVANQLGRSYNPLFLYGPSGLGKTHLLQAVGFAVLARQPSARLLYLSCESFVNDFVEAIEANRLGGFRDRLRSADGLILDDVQFLTSGDRSQEEFFHTFNALHQAGRQIILSADVAPEKIPGLEDRLVSRFKWGLVTQIDAPALETRMAILRKKARLRGLELPESVCRAVSEAAVGNIRQLEGALTALQHVSLLEGRPIDTGLAVTALRGLFPSLGLSPPPASPPELPPPRGITVREILDAVAEHFGLRPTELTGKRRTQQVAIARMIAMFLARRLTGLSLEEVGSAFGGRDHTTVMHAERRIQADRQSDPGVAAAVARIAANLGGSV